MGGAVVQNFAVAVGDKAGDGLVGGGQAISLVGPADELLPPFMVGEGVFDGDASGGVWVTGSFPSVVGLGWADLVGFPGRGYRLAGVVTAEAEVPVVQEDLHVRKVLEADGDTFVARGSRVMHSARSQGIGP